MIHNNVEKLLLKISKKNMLLNPSKIYYQFYNVCFSVASRIELGKKI